MVGKLAEGYHYFPGRSMKWRLKEEAPFGNRTAPSMGDLSGHEGGKKGEVGQAYYEQDGKGKAGYG